MNPYEVLEVSPGASADDIKTAYHRLAKHWHPDRYTGAEKATAEAKFRELAEAFSMLKDVARRPESAVPRVEQASSPAIPKAPSPAAAPLAASKTPEDWISDAKRSLEDGDPERAAGLAQYAIRLDGSQAAFHTFYAQALHSAGGDRRIIVKALETAIQLNPKDVDSMVMLADQFNALGMSARAAGVLAKARSVMPNHPAFKKEGRSKAPVEPAKKEAKEAAGMGDQVRSLMDQVKAAFGGLRRK